MKSREMGAEWFMWNDRQTDRNDKANSRLKQRMDNRPDYETV